MIHLGDGINRATPFGCVLGFLSLLLLVPGGVFWWAWAKSLKLDEGEPMAEASGLMLGMAAGCSVLGLLLAVVGWRMAMGSDMRDVNDPDKPKMRF